MELLRRLLTLFLLFTGLTMCLRPGGPYLSLQEVDFAREKYKNPYFRSADETLEAFIQRRTQGRTRNIPVDEFTALLQLSQNPGESDVVLQRLEDRVIIPPDLFPHMAADPVIYLQHPQRDQCLRIERLDTGELRGLAPGLRTPNRSLGFLLLGLAPVAYVLIPRRKAAPGDLRYGRAASVVLPDLLGFALGSFFFFFALITVFYTQGDGWPLATGLLLLLALIPLSLNLIARHYATLAFRISESALLRLSDSRKQTFAWADMVSCQPYTGKAAGRLGLLLILFARSPGMVGQGLLVAGNVEQGVEISMKNGEKLRVMANALAGYPEIIHSLETHAVPGFETLSSFPPS